MSAVIYARYSSYNQTERSIEGQIEDCEAYARANNIHITGTYIDRARTGTSADTRPDFQRMVKDAEKGRFDAVLVYKLDRFARNRYDSAIYKARLKKYGIRVISVTENISEEPEGIILEAMLEGMAEYYSANLSQNVRRGLRVARENGTFTGGYLPYGYALDGKRVIINESEADAVRYLYAEYAKGTRLKDIVEELNRHGYKPRVGRAFTVKSFQYVLRSRKYLGEYTFGDEDIPSPYPRIVDDDVFEAVQERLAQARHAPGMFRAKVDYLLSGKIYCGHCGSHMVGESGRGKTGKVYHYYACAKRKADKACDKHAEKKDAVEDYVVRETLAFISAPGRVEKLADMLVKEYEKEFASGTCGKLKRMIEAVDRQIDDCVETLIENRKNPAVAERINAKIDALTARKEDLQAELDEQEAAGRSIPTAEEVAEWLRSFSTGDPGDDEFRGRIIDAFVSSVWVFDDKIVIYYNAKGGRKVSYAEMLADVSPSSSSVVQLAPPESAKPEQIIVHLGLFGIVQKRSGTV